MGILLSRESQEAKCKDQKAQPRKEPNYHQRKEIDSLHETIKLLENRIMFKNQQLQKEKAMNNYNKCDDEISEKILEVQKEKKSVDRQLTALVKKESKAQWYLSGKSKKSSKPKNVCDNQSKLPDLF